MCNVADTVGDLMLQSGAGWDHQQLVTWLRPEAISRLEEVDLSTLLNDDRLLWMSSPDRSFSIKRAYWDLNRNIGITNFFLVSGRDTVNWLLDPPFAEDMSITEKEKFTLFGAIVYYKLWGIRNKIYRNKSLLSYEGIQSMVMRCFRDHCSILDQVGVHNETIGGPEAVRWGLLRPGRMKCFVDYASANDVGAVAGVIFDREGSVKCFGAKKVAVSSTFQGELEALSFGADIARPFAAVGVDFYSNNWQLRPMLFLGGVCFIIVMVSFGSGSLIISSRTAVVHPRPHLRGHYYNFIRRYGRGEATDGRGGLLMEEGEAVMEEGGI
uniref:RNase H type-1 domain-containing protein n=1 Tax=Cannabis sativa TaxID=3483 RepID=A0A803Q9L6_CANSA